MPAASRLLDFDIDHYLNRFVGLSFVHRLPQPLARFLGYRAEPPSRVPHLIVWIWSFIGAFVGLSLVGAVFRVRWIRNLNPPVIFPSYGATVILEFNSIESPLAQPRNMLLGQLLSCTVAVGITKIFQFLPTEQFHDLRWLVGALNVGVAAFLMGITKTVHPPAGATALVAGIDLAAVAMGWSLIPLVLIADCLTLGSALLVNNIQRRFPQYWWTPQDLSSRRVDPIETKSATNASGGSGVLEQGVGRSSESNGSSHSLREIKITGEGIEVPQWLVLGDVESDLLRTLHARLRAK